jgi:hypothetical protein
VIGTALNNPEQTEVTTVNKQEHTCADDEVWSDEHGKCVKKPVAKQDEETLAQCMARVKTEHPEMTDDAARAQCTQTPATDAEKGFMDKMMAVFDEAMEKRMSTFWKQVETKMDEAITKVQDDAVQGLRKGLGINDDPVIHLSEMEGMVRKILLEEKPHGKRTETITKDKPTEGSTDEPRQLPSADDLYKRLSKQRSSI